VGVERGTRLPVPAEQVVKAADPLRPQGEAKLVTTFSLARVDVVGDARQGEYPEQHRRSRKRNEEQAYGQARRELLGHNRERGRNH
jgi:hypothetical protein